MKKITMTSMSRLGFSPVLLPLMLAAAINGSPADANISATSPNGLSTGSPTNNAAVRQFLSDAQKAVNSGNFRLAVILLKNAVAAVPNNGAVRAQLGLVLLRSGDPVSAERELRQARLDRAPDQVVLPPLFQAMLTHHEEQTLLTEFPDPGATAQGSSAADILKARALALQQLGNPGDAAAAMDRSLALRRDVSGLLARARLAEQQNNLALAKSLSDEAIKLAPKSSDALMFRLGLLMASNDPASALALANQLVQQFPENLSARLARIEIYLRLKQDNHASSDVNAILAKSPGATIALYYKALILARGNDEKGAWRIAQTLPPEFTQSQPSIAIMISQMAISSGNLETGAALLAAVLAKSPNLIDVRLRLAGIRMRQNSLEAALDIMQPLKDSSDPRALAVLSQIYLKLRQYSNALDTLSRLNATGVAGPGAKRELALVEMQSGASEQGIKDLTELAAKQPTDPTVIAPLVAALVQAKRFPEALAAADRLGADPKQRVQALFFRGQILVLEGDANGALAAFQQALQLDPKNVAGLYYRAGLLEALKRNAEADRDLQVILQIDPKNVVALVKRAEIAARENQDKSVRTLLAQASSLAPQNPTPRIALTRYLIARRDLKGALVTATELVRILPNNVDGLVLAGNLELSLGQKDQAIETFRRLTKLLPSAAAPQMLLANALFAKGDRAGASAALGIAATDAPNSIQVRASQINLLFALGDVKGAITTAQAFQTSNPGSDADLMLAETFVRAKELSQASAVLTRSLAIKPNSKVLVRLAQLAVLAGDKKHAENLMSEWLGTNQNDLEVRTLYATILMQDGMNAKARTQFETVLSQDPNNVVALNNLGWLLQKEDSKRALSLLTLAFKLSPGSADVADTFGWIKLQQKDPKGAVDLLKRAHDMRPKDGEIAYHLVLALDASGNRNAAKGLLKALLDSGVKFDDIVDALKLSETWH